MTAFDFIDFESDQVKSDLLKKYKKYTFELKVIDGALTLIYEGKSYSCSFTSSKFIQEVKQNYSRSESVYSFLKPLLKAYKKKQSQACGSEVSEIERLKILDLTAGFGRDMAKFMLSGQKVVAYEKDPLIYILLKDGLRRFFESEKRQSLKNSFRLNSEFDCQLHYGDSFSALKENTKHYHLIYFDPMFDDKAKKAAPKKHMQMIKSLLEVEAIDKEQIVCQSLKLSDSVVLKASEFRSEKVKEKKKLSFKGFNYYVFEN